MNCEQVTELLPWYLNASLEEAQRATIHAHLANCPHCQRELEETRFVLTASQAHVPEEALLDYATRAGLPDHERAVIERHLAACADCAEQVAMVEASFALQPEPARVLPFRRPARPRVVPQPQPVRIWQYVAIAASVLGLLALGGWWLSWQQSRTLQEQLARVQQAQETRVAALEAENQRLRQPAPSPQPSPEPATQIAKLEARVRELSAPQPNVPVLEVFPHELTQRDQSPTITKLTIPAASKQVTLILNSQSSTAARQYRLEIRNAQNRVVTTASGLQRQATGDYTVSLPTELLPPGLYTFNVYGTVDGRRARLESYRLQVSRK